jgi:glycosyltransferase involved in cell wall biosynthesis
MKVFFTLDTLSIGGTERSTLDILSHFSKETQVKVIYFYKGHELKEAYEQAGIPLHFVGLPTRKSYLQGIRALIKIIRTEKPDIVVSSIARADLLSRIACFITRTPIIGTFVNDSYGAIRVEEHKKRKTYIKFMYAWTLDKMTSFAPKYWIANCKSIAFSNAKALGLNLNKLKVIYRGRDTSKFPVWQAPEINGKIKFVFVGRLMERKGLYELLEVAKMLKEEQLNFQLDIFGGGNMQTALQKIIDDNGLNQIVTLHGTVQQGWKKIYEGHCFVFPSWYEGFSGSLVEAMITGIPIIASDISMNKEAVTDGKTALLFKVKDKEQLFQRMKKVITNYDDVLMLGKNARTEALARFDIKTIASQYEGFLKSVANQNVDTTQMVQKAD